MDTTVECGYEFRVYGNYQQTDWPTEGCVYAYAFENRFRNGEWTFHRVGQIDKGESQPDPDEWDSVFRELSGGDGDGRIPPEGLRVLVHAEPSRDRREHIARVLLEEHPTTLNRLLDVADRMLNGENK